MSGKDKFMDNSAKFQFVFGLVSGIAVMSLILFIVLFIMFWSGNRTFGQPAAKTTTPTATQPTAQQPSVATPPPTQYVDVRPIDETDNAKGPVDAPIEMIEYSDFECPYCGAFEGTLAQVEQNYGDKVRIAYRHFPLSFHAEAQKAAEASECAADQGKFWEMHGRIFAAQDTADFNINGWKKFASELGLNTATFNDCLDSGKTAARVQAGIAEGTSVGVTGTPATFINGQLVSGALPYAQIQAIIEQELQK